MKRSERAGAEERIRQRYEAVRSTLTERARRLFAASEAKSLGHGGIAAAARATGMAPSAIGRGLKEIEAIEAGEGPELPTHRSRRPGGGRKKQVDKDPTLAQDLYRLVGSSTRGDPESALLWTARSLRNLVSALEELGHQCSVNIVSQLLKEAGFSLQGNRKRSEGAQHPDRNAQFEHIDETVRRQLESGQPALSVDTKKKELVGPYKAKGKELRPKHDPEDVNVHDFLDPSLGRAAPYGVYDLAENEAWVSVGISHDTAQFAVASIRKWYEEMGKSRYPDLESLLIIADGGGSNGYRLRLWKTELQKLSDDLNIPISVCHLPPGTSKWNKIEHRLFSFISQNWRGKPLVSHMVIVKLIAATKTKAGLQVKCALDETEYPKGRRVTDEELAAVNLQPDPFHGEWNYSILPTSQACPTDLIVS